MTGSLVGYLVARELPLPPIAAPLYEYVLAGNGLFVRGRRPGLQVLLPVALCTVRGTSTEPALSMSKGPVRGLPEVEPHVTLDYPRVPAGIVERMLSLARTARDMDGEPVEIIFHLSWTGAEWQLEIPLQDQGAARAQPRGPAMGSSYARALIEVHSHHALSPFFSTTDDADETGFRIFGVLGNIFARPALRVRAGLYGHRWEIPAAWVFDSAPEIGDALAEESQP